jgi:hypothetical protein
MVWLATSPANSMAANTRRIAKPIAAPISSSCTRISSPCQDIGSTAGMGEWLGAMIPASSTPSVSLMVCGTPVLPNTGAAAISRGCASAATAGRRSRRTARCW